MASEESLPIDIDPNPHPLLPPTGLPAHRIPSRRETPRYDPECPIKCSKCECTVELCEKLIYKLGVHRKILLARMDLDAKLSYYENLVCNFEFLCYDKESENCKLFDRITEFRRNIKDLYDKYKTTDIEKLDKLTISERNDFKSQYHRIEEELIDSLTKIMKFAVASRNKHSEKVEDMKYNIEIYNVLFGKVPAANLPTIPEPKPVTAEEKVLREAADRKRFGSSGHRGGEPQDDEHPVTTDEERSKIRSLNKMQQQAIE